MPTQITTLLFAVGIVGLLSFDRDKKGRTSKALWIPVAWLYINCSRPVSMWMGILGLGSSTSRMDQAQTYLDGSPVDRNVFVFLLLAALAVLVARNARVGRLLEGMGPLLVFYTYCAFSILWSAYPFVAFKHWIKGIGDVMMVLLILTDSEPSAALKRLLTRVTFVLIPLSVLFIKYIPNLGRFYTVGGAPTYTGVTTQKNTLGVVCLLAGLASLWRFLGAYQDRQAPRRTKLLIAHGAILVMVIWLLRTCDSMTSLSCLFMAGGVMVLINRPALARKKSVVHFLTAATVCFCLFVLFLDSGGEVLKGMGRDPTLTGRTAIWKAVLLLAGNPLIGTGYESFWLGDRLQRLWSAENGLFAGINEAHNGYLEVFLNLGWIGVALMAGVVVKGYQRVVSVFREDPYGGSLGVAFFISELAYNFTEAGFRMLYPLWIFFLLAVIGVPKTPVAHRALTVGELSEKPAAPRTRRNFEPASEFKKARR